MSPASTVAVLFLVAVAFVHLVRVVLGVEILIDGTVVPMWPSAIAALAVGALAVWLWRDAQRRAVGE